LRPSSARWLSPIRKGRAQERHQSPTTQNEGKRWKGAVTENCQGVRLSRTTPVPEGGGEEDKGIRLGRVKERKNYTAGRGVLHDFAPALLLWDQRERKGFRIINPYAVCRGMGMDNHLMNVGFIQRGTKAGERQDVTRANGQCFTSLRKSNAPINRETSRLYDL